MIVFFAVGVMASVVSVEGDVAKIVIANYAHGSKEKANCIQCPLDLRCSNMLCKLWHSGHRNLFKYFKGDKDYKPRK